MSNTGARLAAAAAVCTAVLVSAACGSSSSTMTPADWANGVCTSITTWTSDLKAVGTSLKGNLSKQSLQTGAKQAEDATQTFSDSLKKLGKPDTPSGQQAKDTINQLADELQTDKQAVKKSVDGISSIADIPGAVTSLSATFTTAKSQIASSYKTIQGLDVKGELETAFKQAPACKSVTG